LSLHKPDAPRISVAMPHQIHSSKSRSVDPRLVHSLRARTVLSTGAKRRSHRREAPVKVDLAATRRDARCTTGGNRDGCQQIRRPPTCIPGRLESKPQVHNIIVLFRELESKAREQAAQRYPGTSGRFCVVRSATLTHTVLASDAVGCRGAPGAGSALSVHTTLNPRCSAQ